MPISAPAKLPRQIRNAVQHLQEADDQVDVPQNERLPNSSSSALELAVLGQRGDAVDHVEGTER